MTKKINIFLGGFINITNAQNLNCLALAKHLDKNKFKCHSLELYSGNLESQKGKTEGLNVFKCFYPAKISIYLGFLWGIWKCDVAYLPKGELWRWNRFWLKVLRKKSFSTIEGILDKDNLQSSVDVLGSFENVMSSWAFFDKVYPISSFLGQFNTGRLKKRKGIYDFLTICANYPEIQFFIFGNGEEKEQIESHIEQNMLLNTFLKGTVNHEELAEFLIDVDLHVFPSRSEGFPKVILETAAAGVPTIMYSDYGAEEWINQGENGWVLNTIDEINSLLKRLKTYPELLFNASSGAIKLAASFDWKIRVKDWEKVIEDL